MHLLISLALLELAACFIEQFQHTWLNPSGTPLERAKQLLDAMTVEEKLLLLQGTGSSNPAIGNTAAIPRLGVPSVHLEDGPNGVADWTTQVTTFPSSLTVAASWDRALMLKYGQGMGQEQRGKGMQVMLGPGVNLARVPTGGRNFEYLGEDPYLAGELAAAEIQGIQVS
jgi:beta-glucosidase